MGNCVQSSQGHGTGEGRLVLPQRRRRTSGGEEEEDQGAASPSVVKVKMVLTKGELGWLMARLKAGDRRLEDVLHEMARKREGRADGWRPSLESIVECPAETAAAGLAASSDN
ncbi:uncharacterized protein LOC133920612 [Phragmites australis]|uniref:uncharacterized protein LOC133920612 n=1 Tax=Phragmites australis TaxID=29695 RepID=UPI002D767EEC|nr:uncharacterized protein LOC133920612 [Phragmites australis]